VYRGNLSVAGPLAGTISLLLPPLGANGDVFINRKRVAREIGLGSASPAIALDAPAFSTGDNEVTVIAKPFSKPPRSFDYTSPGSLLIATAAATWERNAFNGLAAVFVQTTDSKGTIVLTATGPGLTPSQQVIVVH
jgi:beta-galactosidase